ncbi:MAG: hypothetical protein MI924_05285 [Chloroflexales bacterium]|nr:hypothetical protein [Chloroflexales bacterium]
MLDADRTNSQVATLVQALHPTVLPMIRQAVRAYLASVDMLVSFSGASPSATLRAQDRG